MIFILYPVVQAVWIVFYERDLLSLDRQEFIGLDNYREIEVPADAANVGGVNLFGAGFGNYPQDLVMRIQCKGKPDRHL